MLAHPCFEKAEAIASFVFRSVECEICEAHKAVAIFRILRAECDSDGNAGVNLPLAQIEGDGQRIENALSQSGAVTGVFHFGLKDAELVTAEPCHPVIVAQNAGDSAGDGDDELISRVMPEGIVDFFEAVEIEIKKGERIFMSGATADLGVDQFIEQKSIGQSGEDIVPGDLLGFGFALSKPLNRAARVPNHTTGKHDRADNKKDIERLLRRNESYGRGRPDNANPGQYDRSL
jgi:hypothetical protein